MSLLLIENCRAYNAPETALLQSILIRNGVIEQVGQADSSIRADRVLDARGQIAAPGFIDVHIQGAGGADVLDATPDALQTISRTCTRFGVTGFLATTIYRPGHENRHLKVVAESVGRNLGGAHLLGAHLEGPFISAERRGMIQPDCLGQPSGAVLDEIHVLLGGGLRMMTLAPELPGNTEVIRTLKQRGAIASFGHSKATYDEAVAGFDAGISHVTHLFNAMPSLHHRDPGPLGAIFERSDVTCQVIADGVHIHPSVLKLAYHALGPERFVTITDGIQAMGLPDGRYVYNNVEYEARDGAARYKDGTLIGTAVGLSQLLARLIRFTHCSVVAAIETVTVNPARILGLEETKGRVAPGYDADLVILDRDLSVQATIVGGQVAYEN